jgi:sortase A
LRRVLRILSIALITAGLVILADVAATLAWKEPVSTIYSSIQQGRAADELERLEESFPSAADLQALKQAQGVSRRARLLADRFAADLAARTGEGIGRVEIPEIDLDAVLVEGTDTASLKKGPGHYPETSLPGQGKTIGIAGHRTTYLAPFRHLDQLDGGDEISVEMPYASFTYEVEKTEIVEPSEVQVVRDIGRERLVLTACNPLYSAAQRIAVFARLTEVSRFAGPHQRWPDP